MRVVGRDHALKNGAADNIARGEVGHRVLARHDAVAVAVAQHGARAAHDFADQEARGSGDVERGRMELYELAVRETRASAEAQRLAVTAGARRVGGLAVDLAGAAGRNNHRGCFDRDFHRFGAAILQTGGADAAAVAQDQVAHKHVRPDSDAWVGAQCVDQGALDFAAGGGAVGVRDAWVGVATFLR